MAATIELTHEFSLIHDDLEDRDRQRRGRDTLWTVVGEAHAVLGVTSPPAPVGGAIAAGTTRRFFDLEATPIDEEDVRGVGWRRPGAPWRRPASR